MNDNTTVTILPDAGVLRIRASVDVTRRERPFSLALFALVACNFLVFARSGDTPLTWLLLVPMALLLYRAFRRTVRHATLDASAHSLAFQYSLGIRGRKTGEVLSSQIKSLRYRASNRGRYEGLYADTQTQSICILPHLNPTHAEEVRNAIRTRFATYTGESYPES